MNKNISINPIYLILTGGALIFPAVIIDSLLPLSFFGVFIFLLGVIGWVFRVIATKVKNESFKTYMKRDAGLIGAVVLVVLYLFARMMAS